jgi:hypothetical protein
MITFLVLHCANYSRGYAREFAEGEGISLLGGSLRFRNPVYR